MCAASTLLCVVAAALEELVRLASTAYRCLAGHQEGADDMLNMLNCKLLESRPLVLHSSAIGPKPGGMLDPGTVPCEVFQDTPHFFFCSLPISLNTICQR